MTFSVSWLGWPFFCGAIWTNCNHPDSFNGGAIYRIDQETYFEIKIILTKKLCQNTCSPWRLSLRMKFSLAGCHPTRKRLPQWFTWKVSKFFLWICLLPTKCIGVSLVLRSGNLLQAPTTGRQPPTRSLAPLSILVGDMVGWPPTPGSRWFSKYALSPHLGHKSEGNWWVQHQGQVSPQPTLGGEAKLLAWACPRRPCLKGQNVLFMGNWNSHFLNRRVLETSVKEYKMVSTSPMGNGCSLHVARLVLKLQKAPAWPAWPEAWRKSESPRTQEEMAPLCRGAGRGEATCQNYFDPILSQ